MKKLLDKLKPADKQESQTKKDDDEAIEKYKDELETQWQEFVHRVRVHEMLKCLKTEHQKLQVLRANIDFEELISDEATLIVDDAEKEKMTKVTINENETSTSIKNEQDDQVSKYNAAKRRTALAIETFKSKNIISDREFEEILELCEDKLEQQALRDAFEEKKNREKYLHNASEKREMLYDFINSRFFTLFMLCVIIISITGIFVLTFEKISTRYSFSLMILDSCIMAIFVVEAIFKIAIYKMDYFKSVWNLLDMLIILVHLLEVTVDLVTRTLALSAEISNKIWFRALKSLRALRLLRVIKFIPSLQVVLLTVFQSMLSMGSIAVLMVLFIFVFAVMGRGLFYESSPVHFGNLWFAFVTLFTLLTLDDWFDLLQNVKNSNNDDENSHDTFIQYWIMFFYLFFYIVIEYFVFLNLFVAVLVDNFQLTLADAEIRKKKEELLMLVDAQKFENMGDLDDDDDEFKVDAMDTDNLELDAEDYFPVQKGTKEAQQMGDIFKDMNSLDFERFLWKRRVSLLNMVMDQALSAQQAAWAVQEAEMKAKIRKELEDNEKKKKHKNKDK